VVLGGIVGEPEGKRPSAEQDARDHLGCLGRGQHLKVDQAAQATDAEMKDN